MLEIYITIAESYDEEANRFVATEQTRVVLEHSLVTLSKWESIWEKAFLNKEPKTSEEVLSYIEIMIQDEKLSPEVFRKLVQKYVDEINDFINAEHSATRLPPPPKAVGYQELVTAELIRYWMLKLNIPSEYDRWHLNRLMKLIRVVALKDTPQKKMSLAERRKLNLERLKQNNTTG